MITATAGWIGLVAAGLAFSEIPRQYLAIPIGFLVLSVIAVDTAIENSLRDHIHDSDGKAQLNGIRGQILMKHGQDNLGAKRPRYHPVIAWENQNLTNDFVDISRVALDPIWKERGFSIQEKKR